jgi:thiol-disulfide isomerase/thioredoxin
MELSLAPEWQTATWFNTPEPLSLSGLRGRVVLLHAFQMLCPGCVSHGLPQAQRVAKLFPDVRVIGLHTVFEHHEAIGLASLRAFLHEYRIRFPVAVDLPGPAGDPLSLHHAGVCDARNPNHGADRRTRQAAPTDIRCA